MSHWVLAVEGGINPRVHGPFSDAAERDVVGRKVHDAQDPACDATFAVEVDDPGMLRIETASFSDRKSHV